MTGVQTCALPIYAIQHAIALPPDEVVVDRAVRRKILRKIAPLATGAQDIHHAVHDRTHVGAALAAARLRRWNERLDIRPLKRLSRPFIKRLIAPIGAVLKSCNSAASRPEQRKPLGGRDNRQAMLTLEANGLIAT